MPDRMLSLQGTLQFFLRACSMQQSEAFCETALVGRIRLKHVTRTYSNSAPAPILTPFRAPRPYLSAICS